MPVSLSMTRRLAVLASGRGSNLQALIDACAAGTLDDEIVLVVSDRPGSGALARAADAGVATLALPRFAGEDRPGYDRRLADAVIAAEVDLVVLAGWMRLLTMEFLGHFPGAVINLHPALPGELPGTAAIERAFAEHRAGTRSRTGVMVHFVPDEGVDDGPVIATVEVPIEPDDTLDSLSDRVHDAEHALLVDALRQLSSTRSPSPALAHPKGSR